MTNQNTRPIIGLTFGAFEIFHQGHYNLLKNAKAKCNHLIVCVSSDKYIEKNKGHRPAINTKLRQQIVKSMKFVDEVDIQAIFFTKKQAVEKFKPDFIFVGDDWTPKTFGGEGLGVPVVYLPRTKDISSTKLRTDK